MTEEEPTFLDLIDRLTRPTPEVIETDDGLKRVERDGLLQQLRGAVFGGMENTGGSSSFGSKPPIDSSAADLLNLIDQQAASVLSAVDPKPTPLGTTEHYVRLWSAQAREGAVYRVASPATLPNDVRPDEQVRVYAEYQDVTAYRLAAQWVAKIEEFFDSLAPADVLAPCPETGCGVEFITKEDDGVTTHARAVILRRVRATGETIDAICRACGREWQRDELPELAELVGAKPLPEMTETFTVAKLRHADNLN